MAWHDRSITLTVSDTGPAPMKLSNGEWTDDYSGKTQTLTLVASTNSSTGKLSWKLTASNNYSGGVGTCIYLKIGDEEIYNAYWTYENRGNRAWDSYPTGDGSASGSITIGTASSSTASFDISLKLCCAQDARGSLSSRYATTSGTLTRTWYTAVGTGTTTIVDNGNNTFKITATKGSNGTNNTAGGPSNLKWSYDSDSYNQTYTSGADISLSIKGTGATRTVYATSTTTATYGSNKPDTASLAIKQYIAPVWSTTSGGLSIAPHQKPGKTRLTLRDNWLLQWEDCTSQGCSVLWGYRIRIYVNNQSYRWFNLSNTDELTKQDPDWNTNAAYRRNRYYYDRANTESAVAVNPNNLVGPNGEKVQPGDKIKFGIYPYTLNGLAAGVFGAERLSAEYEVQNAGIARVKTSAGWKEGQVWVKTSSGWKEASSVQVKTASGWKEST